MAKFSFVLFIIALTLVSAKVPDYLKICKRNDPELGKCVENSIRNLRPKLVSGIPEFNIPSIDPLHMKKAVINLGTGFKAEFQDLDLIGAKNFEISEVVPNLKDNTWSFTVSMASATADGQYEIDAGLAALPLKGKGPIHISATSVKARGVLKAKSVTRGGKPYQWYPSLSLKMEVADYNIELKNLFVADPAIGNAINKVLNEQKAEVLENLLPPMEKRLTEYILTAGNNLVKNFSWDELLPEA